MTSKDIANLKELPVFPWLGEFEFDKQNNSLIL